MIENLFKKCQELLISKGNDYTKGIEIDRHENFKKQQQLAEWFENPIDRPYVNLIGVKLARLSALLNNDKIPNNESIEDTFVDLINYCALWANRRTQ